MVVRPYVRLYMIMICGTVVGWRLDVTRGQKEKIIKEEGLNHSDQAHTYIPYPFPCIRSQIINVDEIMKYVMHIKFIMQKVCPSDF